MVGGNRNSITCRSITGSSVTDVSFIGGGQKNLILAEDGFNAEGCAIVGGATNSITAVTGDANYSIIGGGFNNNISSSSYSGIFSGQNITMDPSDYSVIVGGSGNYISNDNGNSDYSMIGGGGGNRISNIGGTAQYSVISGGASNSIEVTGGAGDAGFGSIGGGYKNHIYSYNGMTDDYSVIAGGSDNYISAATGNCDYGVIGGGSSNAITDAQYCTIPGGQGALANQYGEYAFANGYMSTPGDAQEMKFIVRATFTTQNAPLTNGLPVPYPYPQVPSSGVWGITMSIVGTECGYSWVNDDISLLWNVYCHDSGWNNDWIAKSYHWKYYSGTDNRYRHGNSGDRFNQWISPDRGWNRYSYTWCNICSKVGLQD